LFDYAALAVPV